MSSWGIEYLGLATLLRDTGFLGIGMIRSGTVVRVERTSEEGYEEGYILICGDFQSPMYNSEDFSKRVKFLDETQTYPYSEVIE